MVLSGVLFGTSIPVIKLGLGPNPENPQIPPILFATLRFLVASALVVSLLRHQGGVNWRFLKSRPIWMIGVLNTAGYILQFEGQVLTSSSQAALVIGSAALMIPVVSFLHGTERVGGRRIFGVLLGFVGTALVVVNSQGSTPVENPVLGDLMILGTAVTIAMIFVFSKDLVETQGSRAVTGGIVLITALLLVPFVLIEGASSINLGPEAWFYILFLSVLSTVGAYFFFAKGLETVSPTVSSIILPIEVIVSVGLSVLIFRDPFNFFSGTGAVLIIVGVLLVSFSS